MLKALSYMHLRGVVHRDLKLDNCIFANGSAVASWGDDAPLKLIDFGLSVQLAEGELASGAQGTVYYLAPEMAHDRQYGTAVDMWSLGVIVYMLLCGEAPFNSADDRGIIAAIKASQFTFLPEEARACR